MDLLTEWKIIRKTAAQTVSSAPIPAHPTISPRLDIVEKARTFFPSFWAIAIILAMIKVNPPILDTRIPTRFPWNAGEIRSSRYTPAFTMVALWSNALEGVGATMAPRSQVENGSCADLVSPARARQISGSIAPTLTTLRSCTVPLTFAIHAIATANPRPPRRFIQSAQKLLFTASSERVYPIIKNEITLVISQKKYIQIIFCESTSPNIAARNRNSMEKKKGCLSCTSL